MPSTHASASASKWTSLVLGIHNNAAECVTITDPTGVGMVFKQVPCMERRTCSRREAAESRDLRSVLRKVSAYLSAHTNLQPLFSNTLDKYKYCTSTVRVRVKSRSWFPC